MKKITDLRKRVADFNEALTSGRIIQNIIWDNEAYIVDLNAEEQLFEQGINRLGVEISDYAPYSPVTIAIKEAKGQPTNRVTLRVILKVAFFWKLATSNLKLRRPILRQRI